MSRGKIARGHPLVALLALLGGWVAGRAATWEAPVARASAAVEAADMSLVPGPQSLPDIQPVAPPIAFGATPPFSSPLSLTAPAPPAALPVYGHWSRPAEHGAALTHLRRDFASLTAQPRFFAPEMPGTELPLPPGLPALPPRARRWSMDAWALLRRDGALSAASAGALPATYGASQAGAILRYRLSMSSPQRPSLYLRSTSSAGQVRETGLALGFSGRPRGSIPIVAAVEGRMIDQAGQRRMQAAAMVVTELPTFTLPAGFRGEAYGQAGYVAGDYSTPFADGQIRADTPLFSTRSLSARVGAGVWGGAQEGAARLDAGPSASLAMPLGRGLNGRVAVDWRFRLAGAAEPGSGPAVTLSAGF